MRIASLQFLFVWWLRTKSAKNQDEYVVRWQLNELRRRIKEYYEPTRGMDETIRTTLSQVRVY